MKAFDVTDNLIKIINRLWNYAKTATWDIKYDMDGLVQDCSISIANALEILHSYTKPSILPLSWPKYNLFKQFWSINSR